jgi:hypothetical protein
VNRKATANAGKHLKCDVNRKSNSKCREKHLKRDVNRKATANAGKHLKRNVNRKATANAGRST